jgi:hypothetical protein
VSTCRIAAKPCATPTSRSQDIIASIPGLEAWPASVKPMHVWAIVPSQDCSPCFLRTCNQPPQHKRGNTCYSGANRTFASFHLRRPPTPAQWRAPLCPTFKHRAVTATQTSIIDYIMIHTSDPDGVPAAATVPVDPRRLRLPDRPHSPACCSHFYQPDY